MTSRSPKHIRVCSIAGCLMVQLCVGIIYLWSVFKNPVAVSYGCAPEALAMVSSYMLTAFVSGTLLGGIVGVAAAVLYITLRYLLDVRLKGSKDA